MWKGDLGTSREVVPTTQILLGSGEFVSFANKHVYSYHMWSMGNWDFNNRHRRNMGIRNGEIR